MSKVTTKPIERKLVDTEVLAAVDPAVMEDSFVYVHCMFPIQSPGMLMRIWRTTFLKDLHSSAKSELIHAENISYAPQWTMIPDVGTFTFLLVFSALPKTCTQFDLVEEISQPGGFHVKSIQRNKTDVYKIIIE